MNVVITLPEKLIKAILLGVKSYEIRSKLPLHFDETKDVIFVVKKGSKEIPIYFTIKTFYGFSKIEDVTSYLAIHAAVSPTFIEKYRQGKRRIYAWVIGCACKVDCPSCLYSDLKINKNPQSFIYRDYEWRQISFGSYIWLTKPKNKYTALKPNIEYDNYMLSLSSAKPSTL